MTATTTSIEVQFQEIDGLSVRYADSGGAHEHTVLMTSPWPESLLAFTGVWATLCEHARLFAVDLPGFGASERRDGLRDPRAMGEVLTRLIDEAGLVPPHPPAPGGGASGALFAAGSSARPFSERVVGARGAAGP